MGKLTFTADKDGTLENMLMKDKGISRRTISKLKRTENGITRNGILIRTIDTVKCGDVIVLDIPDKNLIDPNPDLDVTIAFENERLVVFDKPVGMPVHPSIKHRLDTLGNYFTVLYPEKTFRPINRLDRDTSGLCAVAKDAVSASLLQNSIKKTYYAAVTGKITESGVIDAPIAREQESIIKRVVRDDGKKAVTRYKPISIGNRYTLLEIDLETGRTHQIRVHFSYIGHPLAGDELYGGSKDDINEQALHCGKMTIQLPWENNFITVTSPIREDMKRLLEKE